MRVHQPGVCRHLVACLEQILDEELGSREERRIRTSLRLSGIPPGMTLANFDFSFQPSIERGRIERLTVPIRAQGMWSTIYGYLGLASDLNTVVGVSFYEHGETPGIGGRIAEPNRWRGADRRVTAQRGQWDGHVRARHFSGPRARYRPAAA